MEDDEFSTFPPGDPENPRNWPTYRKWLMLIPIFAIDFTVSWMASGFSPATKQFEKDFHVSAEVATLGLSLYVLGLAFGPLALAPLSEYLGRRPIFIISYGIGLLFLLGTAFVQDLGGFLVLRFLNGLFAAVTIANLGGTIADLFTTQETGPAMSVFLWAAVGGSSSGYFLYSFVAQTRPWRDVFWSMLGIHGGLWLIMCITLRETRHTTILRKRAKEALKSRETRGSAGTSDDGSAPAKPAVLQHRGAKELFQVALSRPLRFLTTEAIVIFLCLYNGYLYGISFLLNGAFNIVYGEKGYGFNTIEVGLAFLGVFTGISLGTITNLWQESYYHKRIAKSTSENIPEARVQLSMVASIVFPVSLFGFAWTCFTSIHWIVSIIFTGLFGWSFYTLILMSYMYIEDSYKVFSASALAATGLSRNVAGAGFPLFGTQLYENEGNHWGSSILAFLSILLVPIPFILAFKGQTLRQKSPWARQHMDEPMGRGGGGEEFDGA